MIRTRVKVCGITSREDAEMAVAAGADGLGFIFTEQSPRFIEPETARQIIDQLPALVSAVGVFMDQENETVQEIAAYCRLTHVQLHGNESPGYCEKLNSRVIKSFAVRPATEPDDLAAYAGVVKAFLLDTHHAGRSGGTGRTFDWLEVERLHPPGPVVLAGGLDPDNVAEAIRQVRPFAVDVNSGVEITPGRKDGEKLRRFMREVLRTDLAILQQQAPEA